MPRTGTGSILSALACLCVATTVCAATDLMEIHGVDDAGNTVVWGDSDSFPIVMEASPQGLVAWSPVLVYDLERPAATRRHARQVCTFRYALREWSCAPGSGSPLAGAVYTWTDPTTCGDRSYRLRSGTGTAGAPRQMRQAPYECDPP